MPTVARYLPDGSLRAVWGESNARTLREHGAVPMRASHVFAVAEGPRRGFFGADFTPLAELTGEDRYRVCLAGLYETHEAAAAAERAWLVANWILAPL